MKKLIWSVVIAVVVAGGLGFYIGMHYPAARSTVRNSDFAGRFGSTGSTTFTNGSGGVVAGSIIADNGQSITVQLANGNSQVVFVATTTPVLKSVKGSVSDLSVGDNIVVTGTTNSDGSVTAQEIQLRPTGSSTPAMVTQHTPSVSQ